MYVCASLAIHTGVLGNVLHSAVTIAFISMYVCLMVFRNRLSLHTYIDWVTYVRDVPKLEVGHLSQWYPGNHAHCTAISCSYALHTDK